MDKKMCNTLDAIEMVGLTPIEEIELARFLIIQNRKLIKDYPCLEDALKNLNSFMLVQD